MGRLSPEEARKKIEELRNQLDSILQSRENEMVQLKAETIRSLVKLGGNLPDLSQITLAGTDLCSLDLTFVDFTDSDLTEALLVGCNLTQADLVRTNFHKANLGGANLYNADLTEAVFTEANLAKTDFGEAVLVEARLAGADISWGSDFTYADLTNADFTGANLRSAKFPGTNMSGAIFKGADLTEAEKLTKQQVEQAVFDPSTRFPDYIKVTWKSESEADIVMVPVEDG